MYHKRNAYILARVGRTGKVLEAKGTFYRYELEFAKEEYDLLDAQVIEESVFKKKHPKAYRKLFWQDWDSFIYNFLLGLDWLEFDPDQQFDERNMVFYANWFILQMDMEEQFMILDFHVTAIDAKVARFTAELQAYLKDVCELHVNERQWTSIIDKEQVYFGQKAVNRYLGELMCMYGCKN